MDAIHIQTHTENGIQEEIYMNSYHMKPKEGQKFVKKDVEDKLNEFLRSELENEEYDANHSVVRSKELSSKILELLKKCGYPRYKFIVQVVITSTSGQGIRVASRFLWDPSTDNYASASFKNSSLTCVAMVFGLFYE
ncbi:hypothetical protein FDP41_008405 [Naegleria fowleri]|uniref:Uncharacterized protein n=1 Tax=Naegleria fowleri TaxID=5763 RepID=A0A6A5BGQ7_NAEFO|nr:uncharacterized protein FDP41_008405 [Naegleria fowleri]KAF0973198.1 hypothetical protein FDP41_008405 [Naegleria fowleri]